MDVAVVKEGLKEVRHEVSEVRKEMHYFKLKPVGFLSTGLPPRLNPSPFFVGR